LSIIRCLKNIFNNEISSNIYLIDKFSNRSISNLTDFNKNYRLSLSKNYGKNKSLNNIKSNCFYNKNEQEIYLKNNIIQKMSKGKLIQILLKLSINITKVVLHF